MTLGSALSTQRLHINKEKPNTVNNNFFAIALLHCSFVRADTFSTLFQLLIFGGFAPDKKEGTLIL